MAPQGPARIHLRENGTHLAISGLRKFVYGIKIHAEEGHGACSQCPSIGPLEPGGLESRMHFGHMRHPAAKKQPPPLPKPHNRPNL